MNILVKGNNWLGDAVMSLSMFRSLKEMTPRGRVTVLTKPAFADLYRGVPYVDDVLAHKRGGVRPWMEMVREITRQKFDAAIVLPRSFSAALLVWSARIPRRIGYGRARFLTETPELIGRDHRVRHYHHLLSALGKPPAVRPPRLEILPEAAAWAKEILPGGPWIGLNPGATYGVAKQWFPERFIALGRRLSAVARIAVVGGPSEAELGRRVAQETGGVNLAGRTTISQLAAAIARCALFVTNDTGPMHVADAVGVPIVAIFGPTDWVVTPPFSQDHTIVRHDLECSPCLKRVCPLGHHNCMKLVAVDEVLRACRERIR
jgi:heptosyltransferase-2